MENYDNMQPAEIFTGSVWETGLIQNILESAGIASFQRDELSGTLAPWRAISGGADEVKLLVSAEDYSRAKQLIDAYHNNSEEINDR